MRKFHGPFGYPQHPPGAFRDAVRMAQPGRERVLVPRSRGPEKGEAVWRLRPVAEGAFDLENRPGPGAARSPRPRAGSETGDGDARAGCAGTPIRRPNRRFPRLYGSGDRPDHELLDLVNAPRAGPAPALVRDRDHERGRGHGERRRDSHLSRVVTSRQPSQRRDGRSVAFRERCWLIEPWITVNVHGRREVGKELATACARQAWPRGGGRPRADTREARTSRPGGQRSGLRWHRWRPAAACTRR